MTTKTTRAVVSEYLAKLADGDVESALRLLADDVVFTLPSNEWNAVIPYLGEHVGVPAVAEAFRIRGETTTISEYGVRDLRVDDDQAFAIIYTKAEHAGTGQVFAIEDAHRFTVADGRITRWTVYFDPNEEVAAFVADRDHLLQAAVLERDSVAATQQLAAGADPDRRNPDTGLTMLMHAAGQADLPMVRLLLESGADLFATDSRAGTTALHKACQGGSLDVARTLVQAGAFVDAVAPTTGHTPLMDALWYKYPDIAEYLLSQGAGLNVQTSYGFSLAEHFAYELAVNTIGQDRLLQAEASMKRRQDQDRAQAESATLLAATAAGDVEAVRRLLADGAEVDQRGPVLNSFNDRHTPLLVASRDGHAEIVTLLLEAGADVNATEPTFGAVPLHKAVYNGHAEITATIAGWPGVDLDFQGPTNGYTPLHDALWHGYATCAEILIDAGASLNRRGHDGRTVHELAVEAFGPDHPLATRTLARD